MSRFKQLLEERIKNDSVGIDNLYGEMLANLDEAIDYINNECTDLEFYYMADTFGKVASMSESKEFIDAVSNRFIHISDNSLDLLYIKDMVMEAMACLPEEEI